MSGWLSRRTKSATVPTAAVQFHSASSAFACSTPQISSANMFSQFMKTVKSYAVMPSNAKPSKQCCLFAYKPPFDFVSQLEETLNLTMQSLFDTCASKMIHKEFEEICALPIPGTVLYCLLHAQNSRQHFRSRYERNFGELADKCFVFGQFGGIHIANTLANIEKCDLKQGFRYNCAFGKKEQLSEIWKKLSDEDKAALNADSLFVVQFYSALLTKGEVHHGVHVECMREALQLNLFDPLLDVYRFGDLRIKKQCLFVTWLAALWESDEHLRGELCAVACIMQSGRDFDYDAEDRKLYKEAIRLRSVLPDLCIVRNCSQICGLQEFEELMMEIVAERSQ